MALTSTASFLRHPAVALECPVHDLNDSEAAKRRSSTAQGSECMALHLFVIFFCWFFLHGITPARVCLFREKQTPLS